MTEEQYQKLIKIKERIDSKEAEEKLKNLFSEKTRQVKLITKYDIMNCLGIDLLVYSKLQNELPTATKEEAEMISYVMNKINSFSGVNNILNDHSIKSGARLSKTTMFYISKQQEEEKELVIINVNVVGDDPLTIKKLKENK